MARFVDAIDLPLPVEEAFHYLADFSHTAEWDPGVASAEQVDAGPVGPGSRFRVLVSFLGRRIPFEYAITTYEPPSRLVLEGRGEDVLSIDEITFVPRGEGTRVTYEARIELPGLRRLADPLLQPLFQLPGRLATRGLRERVAARAQAARVRTRSRAETRPSGRPRSATRTRSLREPAASHEETRDGSTIP